MFVKKTYRVSLDIAINDLACLRVHGHCAGAVDDTSGHDSLGVDARQGLGGFIGEDGSFSSHNAMRENRGDCKIRREIEQPDSPLKAWRGRIRACMHPEGSSTPQCNMKARRNETALECSKYAMKARLTLKSGYHPRGYLNCPYSS